MKNHEIDLAALPERPPRTVLEPYAAAIEELLLRGWGYRDVARIMKEQFGVSTSRSSVARFVQRSAHPARRQRTEPSLRQPQAKRAPIRAPEEAAEFHFDSSEPLTLKAT